MPERRATWERRLEGPVHDVVDALRARHAPRARRRRLAEPRASRQTWAGQERFNVAST
ncbi:hypothetical protein SO694_0014002 [Aureococcus anophagefferens]|uniref:Uncharacterized protein n=1 Tax=Aureococcus anophagefferens TaxID=44056 RepID=A0ABR1FPR5_AURAN